MSTAENPMGFDVTTTIRSFDELSPEEIKALKAQRQRAIDAGDVPKVPPNVFQILMKDEVIENAPF